MYGHCANTLLAKRAEERIERILTVGNERGTCKSTACDHSMARDGPRIYILLNSHGSYGPWLKKVPTSQVISVGPFRLGEAKSDQS